MKIGIIVIATNKYFKFFDRLYYACQRYLFPKSEKKYFLMTDRINEGVNYIGVKKIFINHEQWPNPTLKRFHYITNNMDKFQDVDYLVYLDVDMDIVDFVYENILPEYMAVTHHPGFYNTTQFYGTPERRTESTAFINYMTYLHYVAGGFFLGKRDLFLKMSKKLKDNIQKDLDNNIIAIWHDESHLNWYVVNHKFLFNFLTPEYCFPEGWDFKNNLSSLSKNKKIIALDKNHQSLRN